MLLSLEKKVLKTWVEIRGKLRQVGGFELYYWSAVVPKLELSAYWVNLMWQGVFFQDLASAKVPLNLNIQDYPQKN